MDAGSQFPRVELEDSESEDEDEDRRLSTRFQTTCQHQNFLEKTLTNMASICKNIENCENINMKNMDKKWASG